VVIDIWQFTYRLSESSDRMVETQSQSNGHGSMRLQKFSFEVRHRPNKALQLTANPLRGLPAAELGRYAASFGQS